MSIAVVLLVCVSMYASISESEAKHVYLVCNEPCTCGKVPGYFCGSRLGQNDTQGIPLITGACNPDDLYVCRPDFPAKFQAECSPSCKQEATKGDDACMGGYLKA